MPYQVRPQREFLVKPVLPESLSRLSELAYNLQWSWNHTFRSVFRRLDPQLWKLCNHNPVLMLGRVSQESLNAAAEDPRYLAAYQKACEINDTYLKERKNHGRRLVAYFSMEYGLLDCMPIYSGGLGVLSGDHLKGASDSGIPLVAVGLLYQKGYMRQLLNADGWQTELNPVNDFHTLPVRPVLDAAGNQLQVHVDMPRGRVHIGVWFMDVGRVRLYLLDTNLPENTVPEYRDITDMLYGGDIHNRIRQEIVLGIGGIRALQAVGLQPTVFHMNEGHAAFSALERIRLAMRDHGLSFQEALEATRKSNIFTTHTCVPAGIDLFDRGLLMEYFQSYITEAGIRLEDFILLGCQNLEDPAERFSMAVCALKASAYRNAVSVLHEEVSQEIFADLWPNTPVNEVPITSVTNGVHLPTFLNGDLAQVYDQYLRPDWRETYTRREVWKQVEEIPDHELWEAHKRRKRQLIAFVRERLENGGVARNLSTAEIKRASEVLDPEALTIGFARRFATYKRATLIFRDAERLNKLLNRQDRPIQIIIAGKAHPKDQPGKELIQQIFKMTMDPRFSKRLVFLEDYGIEVARQMVQGVDLWLNNPRRGEEACGTSGMKAALNGVLNLSILDGWFDEAYEESGGWAIGDRTPHTEQQNDLHANIIYSLLENEIAPLFYQKRDESSVPEEWVRRMRTSIKNLSPQFNCQRMVEEYDSRFYAPAHQSATKLSEASFNAAREAATWNDRLSRQWGYVRFLDTGNAPGSLNSGQPVNLRVVLDLAGLKADDVSVEAVIGPVAADGTLAETMVHRLLPEGRQDQAFVFGRDFVPERTGRLGIAYRVTQNHIEDPMTRPAGMLVKWA
jgi:glycogen phosphorylase